MVSYQLKSNLNALKEVIGLKILFYSCEISAKEIIAGQKLSMRQEPHP